MRITSSIPLPPEPNTKHPTATVKRKAAKRPASDFERMKVGDSIRELAENAPRLRAAANRYKRANPGWDYVTRDENNTHVRLWRKA